MPSIQDIRAQYPQYNDMSDGQLADALHSKFYADMPRDQFDAKIGLAPVIGPNDASGDVFAAPEPPPAARPDSFGRSLQLGTQNVGTGLAHLAGAPVDIVTGALNGLAGIANLATRGINWGLGTEIPRMTGIEKPFGGSDSIRDAATAATTAIGAPPIPESQQSPKEKIVGNIVDFGTQGLGGGAGLAMRAPAAAEAIANGVRPFGATMLKQYMDAPARTVLGDTASGVGAGVADSASKEYVPQDQWYSPIANTMAILLGGGTGAAVPSTVEGVGNVARSTVNNRVTDTNVPPQRMRPDFTRAETESAARVFQDAAVNPGVAAQNIRDNAGELAAAARPGETPVNPSQMPTSGLLSQDPGLVTREAGERTRNGVPFIERDQNVKEAAADRVASLRDPSADQSLVTRKAEQYVDTRRDVAQRPVDHAQGRLTGVEMARQEAGAPLAATGNTHARANASSALDRAVVDETYIPARAEKNRLYNEGVSPETPVDLTPAARAADQVAERVERLPPSMQHRAMDGETLRDMREAGQSTYDVATSTRQALSEERNRARAAGDFTRADNLGEIRAPINRAIDEANPAAEQNYRENFAPRFRPGPGDEATRFTKAIDRDPTRSTTPRSETAGRFLTSPEKAQALTRMLDGSPSQEAGHTAVRDYLRSDFAMSAMNPNGTVNPQRAAAWARNNADVLAQFPQARGEVDGIIAQARRGERLSAESKAALEQAKTKQGATESEISRSVAGTLLREDPRDVASKLLNGGYGAEKKVDEINKLLGGDKQARSGWKAAVSEVLADRVTNSKKVGENNEVQYARLAKEFKDNEALLAKTFDPEEMNTLRQAHKLLGYFKEAEKRATVGSNSVDKMNQIPGWVQLAARHVYGDLRGGGIIKRFKLFMDLLPSDRQSIDELVHIAWFNPEVAAYLLERPVKNHDAVPYNINLKRLMAGAEYGRDSAKEK